MELSRNTPSIQSKDLDQSKDLIQKKRIKKAWKLYDRNQISCLFDEKKEVYEKLEESKTCTVCDSMIYVMDDGFPTCVNPGCGTIDPNVLDYSPEWNFFGKDNKAGNDMVRCGNPMDPLLKESSTACKVLKSAKTSYEMRKIDKWIEWQSMPHKEKTLYDEFQYITNMGRIAGVSTKIIETALTKHKEISDEQMFRGVNRDGIKAASIYLAYRMNGYPRTAGEIAKMFMLDKKHATKGCAIAVNILNNIERNFTEQTELCKITTSAIIDRYCGHFDLFDEKLCLLAKFIAYKIEKEHLILDNTPQAIASGIVYFINQVCHLGINKQEIIQKCEISDVTVNKCYKKLLVYKDELVPSCVLSK